MAEIVVLPLSEWRRLDTLFARVVRSEGSLEWFESLAETALSPTEQAVVVVALDNNTPMAALPLALRGSAMRALTAPYTTVYAPPLAEKSWAHRLGSAARKYVNASLHLEALDPLEPGVSAYLQGIRASGLSTAQYPHFINRYERIAGFEDYWNARPSRLKATVQRRLAQARAQAAQFRCYRDHFEEAVATYQDIYRASWKPAEPHQKFISDMVTRLAHRQSVRLGVMTLAGRPVAAQIWLLCGRKGTIFKLAHREDARHSSPGTLLTHWMIQTLVRDDRLEEIDFGRGDDAYKRDWLPRQRTRIGLVAANWRSASGLRFLAGEVLPTRLSGTLRQAVSASPATR
jgi:CelD/BcsL family acetyltransferase involved in cellulose biosynthesis